MKHPYIDAYNVLRVMGVPVFTNMDNDELGNFSISGEDTESYKWADYYSSPTTWDLGVNPALEAVLAQFGLMCEWVNPGYLSVYEA